MERELPARRGLEAAAGTARCRGSGATRATDTAPGRREMNVAVLKTKAEQSLAEAFRGVAAELPGGAEVRQVRTDAIRRFGALGLPHRRIEAWKYTDLRNLMKEALPLASRQGCARRPRPTLDAALGPLAGIDAHARRVRRRAYAADAVGARVADGAVTVASLAHRAHRRRRTPAELLASSATATTTPCWRSTRPTSRDGAVIDIAANAKLEKPLLIVSVRARPEPQLVATRNVVQRRRRCRGDDHRGLCRPAQAAKDAQLNAATEIVVGKGAAVSHVKCAWEPASGAQLVELARRSRRRCRLSRLPLHGRRGAGAQPDRRRVHRHRRQVRPVRRLPGARRRAHRHDAGRRPCRAAVHQPRAVQGRARRITRAACSRARSSCARTRRRPTASRWRRC